MQRTNRKVLPLLLIAAAGGTAERAGAQAAATSLRVTLDAEAVEIVRAWRRSRGLDAPDAQADARVAALVQRLQSVASRDAPVDRPRPATVVVSDDAAPWNPTGTFASLPLPLPQPQWSRGASLAGSSDRNDLSRSD